MKDKPSVCMLPTGHVRHRLRILVGADGITWCGLMVSKVDVSHESKDRPTTCITCGPVLAPHPLKHDYTLRWSLRGKTMEEAPISEAWDHWVQGFRKSHSSSQDLASAYLGFVAGWFSLAERLQLEEARQWS